MVLATILVALASFVAPADAATTRLCNGFGGCAAQNRGSAGYSSVYTQSFWGQFSGHNCTNYVAYRMQSAGAAKPWSGSIGNAKNWGTALARMTNQTPTVGSVAWWNGSAGKGADGHVAYVEQVLPDGIIVSQDSYGGDFSWDKVTPGAGWPTGFIHIKDVELGSAQPVGSLDRATGMTRDGLRLAGWAFDPDQPRAPIEVHAYIDGPAGVGRGVNLGVARLPRTDVGQVHPQAGPDHGFDVVVPGVSPGQHSVHLYAINAGGGVNPEIRSLTFTVPQTQPGSPVGSLDAVEGLPGGAARIGGWTYDPDAATSTTAIHVYLDGAAGDPSARFVDGGPAAIRRDDVGATHQDAGRYHGFDFVTRGLSPGWHTAFVFALNRSGGGENPLLGQRAFFVPSGDPLGNFEDARNLGAGAAQLSGWTLDPDEPTSPVNVHVYVDGPAGQGRFAGSAGAVLERADVQAAFRTTGSRHGFRVVVPGLTPGNHRLWLYAINLGPGSSNPLIGVRDANVTGSPAGSPVGHFDSASPGRRSVVVRGWTLDPDAPRTAARVHIYLDGPPGQGRGIDIGPARVSRPDVAKVHPQAGARHGFDFRVSNLPPGRHSIYAYAINVKGGGENPFLGAFTVTIRS